VRGRRRGRSPATLQQGVAPAAEARTTLEDGGRVVQHQPNMVLQRFKKGNPDESNMFDGDVSGGAQRQTRPSVPPVLGTAIMVCPTKRNETNVHANHAHGRHRVGGRKGGVRWEVYGGGGFTRVLRGVWGGVALRGNQGKGGGVWRYQAHANQMSSARPPEIQLVSIGLSEKYVQYLAHVQRYQKLWPTARRGEQVVGVVGRNHRGTVPKVSA